MNVISFNSVSGCVWVAFLLSFIHIYLSVFPSPHIPISPCVAVFLRALEVGSLSDTFHSINKWIGWCCQMGEEK